MPVSYSANQKEPDAIKNAALCSTAILAHDAPKWAAGTFNPLVRSVGLQQGKQEPKKIFKVGWVEFRKPFSFSFKAKTSCRAVRHLQQGGLSAQPQDTALQVLEAQSPGGSSQQEGEKERVKEDTLLGLLEQMAKTQ